VERRRIFAGDDREWSGRGEEDRRCAVGDRVDSFAGDAATAARTRISGI